LPWFEWMHSSQAQPQCQWVWAVFSRLRYSSVRSGYVSNSRLFRCNLPSDVDGPAAKQWVRVGNARLHPSRSAYKRCCYDPRGRRGWGRQCMISIATRVHWDREALGKMQ
jgi:hypothetical protein